MAAGATVGARSSRRTSIRFRLGVALAIGLTPILLLGAAQAFAAYRHDASEHQRTLLVAAQRSEGPTKVVTDAADEAAARRRERGPTRTTASRGPSRTGRTGRTGRGINEGSGSP